METETLDILGIDEIEADNTAIDDINSEVVNLIFVAIDQSGSMSQFVLDMKKSLSSFKQALTDSKEADEILVARADFADYVDVGGYKRIVEFDTKYIASGGTKLYDVVIEGARKLNDYMSYLKNQGMRVKAVFAVFSDGEDTASSNSISPAKNEVAAMNSAEVVTAFISFGPSAMPEAKRLGFVNILQVGSSESELRKAFSCLSKSVIENSQSAVSKTVDFFTV